MDQVAPQIILPLILYANLLFTPSSWGKKMLGNFMWPVLGFLWMFYSKPTYLAPFTPLGPSFARFNNEWRANQLPR